MVADRPEASLPLAGAVHRHRMTFVDAARDVGIAAGLEYRDGAGVGVDAGEVVWCQREAALRVAHLTGAMQENPHLVCSNRHSSAPNTRAQNLNRESTSGKNGGSSVPRRRFSKVEQAADSAGCREAL